MPLDEAYSFDAACVKGVCETKRDIVDTNHDVIDTSHNIVDTNCDTIDTSHDTADTNRDTVSLEARLLLYVKQDARSTQKEYPTKLNVSVSTVKRLFAKLQKDNILVREGTNRKGQWIINHNRQACQSRLPSF